MLENILQLTGSNEQPNNFPNGYSYLQDIYSKFPQPISTYTRTNTPQNMSQSQMSIGYTPTLPRTGSITHNVTRMLNDSDELQKSQPPITSRSARYSPYSTSHFLSFRRKMLNQDNSTTQDEDQEELTVNISSNNMSITTEDGSISPASSISSSSNNFQSLPSSDTPPSIEASPLSATPSNSFQSLPLSDILPSIGASPLGPTSSSNECSPSSGSEMSSTSSSVKTPNNEPAGSNDKPKKNTRTNYTNEQVHALLKIFHETPYPDSEMMENIGKDLGIPEKKVKIWFQNKRARWRRRVNSNNNSYTQPILPVSPMLSPLTPYGFIPTGQMMTSSPIPGMNSYYHWMQGQVSQYSNQRLPGHFPTNPVPSNFQGSDHSSSLQNHASPFMSMTSFAPAMSSALYNGTVPQQSMTSDQTGQSIQYPSQVYASHIPPRTQC